MSIFFFFNDTATTEIYTLSLHDALPICGHLEGRARISGECAGPPHVLAPGPGGGPTARSERNPRLRERQGPRARTRSEEHTSELQAPCNLVCRLLLVKT